MAFSLFCLKIISFKWENAWKHDFNPENLAAIKLCFRGEPNGFPSENSHCLTCQFLFCEICHDSTFNKFDLKVYRQELKHGSFRWLMAHGNRLNGKKLGSKCLKPFSVFCSAFFERKSANNGFCGLVKRFNSKIACASRNQLNLTLSSASLC